MAPFFIGSGLFGVAALGIWRLSTSLRVAVHQGVAVPKTDVLRELREGLVILGSNPACASPGAAHAQPGGGVHVFVLGPAYMSNVLGRAPDDTYLVLVPATVGMVVSAVVLAGHGGAHLARRHAARRLVLGGASLLGWGCCRRCGGRSAPTSS